MNLCNNVSQFIRNQALLEPGSLIIVGLSGGPDSVCLLSLLKELAHEKSLRLIAVHIDHQWRSNSVDDALFCRSLASKLDVTYIERKASETSLTKKYNGSKEEMGRALRRAILEEVAKEHNASAIALAHHQDDQQETFFLRMIRGASIAGLSSMRPKQGLYVRPLLNSFKSEILAYLEEHNLSYVLDHTNENTDFLRNGLRHKVLPAIKDCDARFDKTFVSTLRHIQETDQFIERVTQRRFEEISRMENEILWVDCTKFFESDSFLHHPILLKWLCHEGVKFNPSTGFFDEIIRFMGGDSKQHELNQSWAIIKHNGNTRILKNSQT